MVENYDFITSTRVYDDRASHTIDVILEQLSCYDRVCKKGVSETEQRTLLLV